MEILSNQSGLPLMAVGKRVVAFTTGGGGVDPVEKLPDGRPKLTFTVGKREYVCWGGGNAYPEKADETIRSCGVLQTALGFKARTCFGQGVLPYVRKGFDADGEPVLVPVADGELLDFLGSYTFRAYMEGALRDLFKFGNAFPVFYFNKDGRIVRLSAVNARHCRISRDKKSLLVYPDFQYAAQPITAGSYRVFDMLDEDDPFLDFERRKVLGKLGSKPLAFPRLKNYFSNNDFYGAPDWEAALRSGWIDIAKQVPVFLKHAYENAMSLMWHIQIPASWYDWKFPKEDYSNDSDGEAADTQSSEESQSVPSTSKQLIFAEYLKKELMDEGLEDVEMDENGYIYATLPANTKKEIPTIGFISHYDTSPDCSGKGVKASIVSNYVEKQQVLDPVLLALRHNYPALGSVVLKYKETILTTLNTGNSVGEVES